MYNKKDFIASPYEINRDSNRDANVALCPVSPASDAAATTLTPRQLTQKIVFLSRTLRFSQLFSLVSLHRQNLDHIHWVTLLYQLSSQQSKSLDDDKFQLLAVQSLIHLLSFEINDFAPQAIANFVLAVGRLSRILKFNNQSEPILAYMQRALEQLLTQSPSSQHIANSIAGVGEFVLRQKAQVDDAFIAVVLQLFSKLQTHFTKNKEIATSILGIGNLAKAKQLQGLDSGMGDVINNLMLRLIHNTPNEIDIAQSLLGLGDLANSKALDNISLDAHLLNQLLIKLTGAQTQAKHIAMSIFGFGNLAKNQVLTEVIPESVAAINYCLLRLENLHQSSQDVSNVLLGIANIVKKGLTFTLNDESFACIETCITRLTRYQPNEQHISNSLLALGDISKLGWPQGLQLQMQHAILDLLGQLLALPQLTSQSLANSLLGFAKLVKQGLFLVNSAQAQTQIQKMLLKIGDFAPNMQEAANFILSLGYLAKFQWLDSLDEACTQGLLRLVDHLRLLAPNPQAIATCLLGISLLLQQNVVPFMLQDESQQHLQTGVSHLIEQMPEKASLRYLANTFYAYGIIQKHLRPTEEAVCGDKLFSLLRVIANNKPLAIDISQTFLGLMLLIQHAELAQIPQDLERQLLEMVINSADEDIQHPQQICNVLMGLHSLLTVSSNHNALLPMLDNAVCTFLANLASNTTDPNILSQCILVSRQLCQNHHFPLVANLLILHS